MTTHHLHLHDYPFRLITSGRKTVESRLYDTKRQSLSIGDTLIFTHRETGETIRTHIAGLQQFRNFSELLETIPLQLLGATNKQQELAELRKYYTSEEEEEYGVVAITVERV